MFLLNDPGYHVLAVCDEVLGFGLEPSQSLSPFPVDIIVVACQTGHYSCVCDQGYFTVVVDLTSRASNCWFGNEIVEGSPR